MKKFLKNLILTLAIVFSASLLVFSPVFADDASGGGGNGGGGGGGCDGSFLGFVPWYCNVNLEGISSTSELGNTIWVIVGNVATDLSVAAAYLVLGYVIYGGYLYIFNSDSPAKIAIAKKTLSQAFIGLAIVMGASIIVSSVRIALSASNLQSCLSTGGSAVISSTSCVDANSMVTNLIKWTVGIAGAVALIFVVYGAITYITSAGDAGKLQKAKNMILYSLIGLIIVALAEIITSFVSGLIHKAVYSSDNSGGSGATSLYLDDSSFAKILNEKEINEINQIS